MALANTRSILAISGPSVMPNGFLNAMHGAAPTNSDASGIFQLGRNILDALATINSDLTALDISNASGALESATAIDAQA